MGAAVRGYDIHPREVEDVLRAHPAIQDVAVVGLPSDGVGETVAAFVVPNGPTHREGGDAPGPRALAPHERPSVVRFLSDLPRNALGKVLRDLLEG